MLFPGTLDTLCNLKAKGYQMHIITNGFREVQNKKLVHSGLSGFFTKVFISEDIQANKPNQQIFEHALKSTNARKKKSVMIGDNWDTTIEGALNFGMDQIMFLNQEQNAVPSAINSMRLASEQPFIELKHHIKTYFTQKMAGLTVIL